MFVGYFLLFLGLLYLLWSLYVRSSHHWGAPFVPTEAKVVERIIKLADIKKGEVFYDLGSGDGRVVIAAALAGARALGIEEDLARVWYSRLWLRLYGIRNARIIKGNFFNLDLSEANTVNLFLLQETNQKLKEKLLKELKPGSKVISYGFTMEGWKPVAEDRNYEGYFGPLFLYEIPERT